MGGICVNYGVLGVLGGRENQGWQSPVTAAGAVNASGIRRQSPSPGFSTNQQPDFHVTPRVSGISRSWPASGCPAKSLPFLAEPRNTRDNHGWTVDGISNQS